MKYQVVNPATGQVEQEYPTATDAEIAAVAQKFRAACDGATKSVPKPTKKKTSKSAK